jgi:hypothetical protein
MAIYHFSVKTISRGAGRSAVACSAYRSAEKLIDERQGKEQDYTKKIGVEFKNIYAPENTNSELLDRNQLWNRVEKVERRKDANLAREFEIAFPYELNKEQREQMLDELCKKIVERHNVIVDAVIHAPHIKGGTDDRNYHAHIMFTGRQIDTETGDFAKKRNRDFNKENSSKTVNEWRKDFAELTNRHLEKHGFDQRIDHRSHAERGIDLEPTIHEGSKVTELRRQGINTEISVSNDLIRARNAEKQQSPQIINGLDHEIALSEKILGGLQLLERTQKAKDQHEIEFKATKQAHTATKEKIQPEQPKTQENRLERKTEPPKTIEKPSLNATQQFNLLMNKLAHQKQQEIVAKLRSEMKVLKSDYAEQIELSKKPKPMFFGKFKWEQEQIKIRTNLNSLKTMFDKKKNQASLLESQKPYTSHEDYKAVAKQNPALYLEMLKEKEQQEAKAKSNIQEQELVRGAKTQSKDRER